MGKYKNMGGAANSISGVCHEYGINGLCGPCCPEYGTKGACYDEDEDDYLYDEDDYLYGDQIIDPEMGSH
jgi:hypothetical protein